MANNNNLFIDEFILVYAKMINKVNQQFIKTERTEIEEKILRLSLIGE